MSTPVKEEICAFANKYLENLPNHSNVWAELNKAMRLKRQVSQLHLQVHAFPMASEDHSQPPEPPYNE